jgi:LuxR family maltose regulon positive regulatory protein
MGVHLLATKLFIPPAGQNPVLRKRLFSKLDACLQPNCRLTLVCAPAGFGKTTLVSTWAARLQSMVDCSPIYITWLSLEKADNDPLLFWQYIISAIQAQKPSIGKRSQTLLQASHSPDYEEVQSLLVNDLAEMADDLILILDDFHHIGMPVIHKSLSFFIDHLPPKMHVLILSRTDPALPLSLLRGRGQVVEIRLADLRFTDEEAAVFLNEHIKLSLPVMEVAVLNAKTEGWVAGLQMAGISMQGRHDPSRFVKSFSGSNRYILDYLTDEILDCQPVEIQTFLLHTSILDRLSAPLCDAVVGGSGKSQAMLIELERANLFLVPLDLERHWYRYHHLFAEILRLKLAQSDPNLPSELLKRAAVWCEANGMLEEAISYLHASGDTQGLAHLINQHVLPLIKEGAGQTLRKCARLLPEEMFQTRPWLCVLKAWVYSSQAEAAEAEQWLDRAQAILLIKPDEPTGEISGIIYAIRTEILHTRGDISGTIETAFQALEHLDPAQMTLRMPIYYSLSRAYYACGDLDRALQVWSEFTHLSPDDRIYHTYASILSMNCAILGIQGKLNEAAALYRNAIDYMLAHDIETFFISGNHYNGLGMVTYQKNDLEEAYQLVTEGLRRNQSWGNLNAISVSLASRAQIQIALGHLDGAWTDLQEVAHIEQKYTPYFDLRSTFLVSRVRYYLAKGDMAAAVSLVQESGVSGDAPLNFQREQDHITLSRVQLAQGKYAEASSLLKRLSGAAQSGGRFGRLIEILNLWAVAFYLQRKISEALRVIEHSLELAEPESYIRIFIDLQEPMAQLLELAVKNGIHPEYARQLLANFPAAEDSKKAPINVQKHNLALLEPLTQREIEVLQLIAEGQANKEIAKHLFISLRTVKFHTTNLYAKLEVSGRAQAIIKARELGLLG